MLPLLLIKRQLALNNDHSAVAGLSLMSEKIAELPASTIARGRCVSLLVWLPNSVPKLDHPIEVIATFLNKVQASGAPKEVLVILGIKCWMRIL